MNTQNKTGLAPKLARNSVTHWGYEFLAENLAPCTCGGTPIQIEGGIPKTFRYYCSNVHSQSKCAADSGERETLA